MASSINTSAEHLIDDDRLNGMSVRYHYLNLNISNSLKVLSENELSVTSPSENTNPWFGTTNSQDTHESTEK